MAPPSPLESVASVVHVSSIALIPKPHKVNKWWLMVNLSYSWGSSVNTRIAEECASILYIPMDKLSDASSQRSGHKIDLEGAHNISQCTLATIWLGITWQGQIYIVRALAFGLHSAPKCTELIFASYLTHY